MREAQWVSDPMEDAGAENMRQRVSHISHRAYYEVTFASSSIDPRFLVPRRVSYRSLTR